MGQAGYTNADAAQVVDFRGKVIRKGDEVAYFKREKLIIGQRTAETLPAEFGSSKVAAFRFNPEDDRMVIFLENGKLFVHDVDRPIHALLKLEA